jgi:ABC-type polysaccharide/polyol phosphate export permease
MKNHAWGGDYYFLLSNLMQKDFKIRYRNMSLGVFWSLLNPLVTMGVLTFVFTKIFPNNDQRAFPVFLLCGIVPYNFFSFAWGSGTQAVVDGTPFIKRVAIPREIIPIASVLSNCLHLIIQIGLLLAAALVYQNPVNKNWIWLPVIWGLFVVFVSGLVLITSAINVFVRDVRYLVESFNAVLFWLVPVFYPFSIIQPAYKEIYALNPVAAMVMALRNILLENSAPGGHIMRNLALVSTLTLILGAVIFRYAKRSFYDYL